MEEYLIFIILWLIIPVIAITVIHFKQGIDKGQIVFALMAGPFILLAFIGGGGCGAGDGI